MFGMSVFQSVLERLKAEGEEVAEDESPSATARGLNAGFVGNLALSGFASSSMVERAYFDTAGDGIPIPLKPVPKPVMPQHLGLVGPHDIAIELSLSEADTVATLAEKRRRFAAGNHPDRHHPDFRTNATIRMKIANMLIDEAQRRLRLIQRN